MGDPDQLFEDHEHTAQRSTFDYRERRPLFIKQTQDIAMKRSSEKIQSSPKNRENITLNSPQSPPPMPAKTNEVGDQNHSMTSLFENKVDCIFGNISPLEDALWREVIAGRIST